MRLTVEAFGETVIDRQLMRLAGNLEIPMAVWELVGTILRGAAERQFDTEGGYASGGWPKLAESTVANKAREGLDPHILRATDALMESLTRKFDPNHIERPSKDSLTFGSMLGYGIYHASTAARTKIPYRPPLALTEADKRLMIKEIQAVTLGKQAGGALAVRPSEFVATL